MTDASSTRVDALQARIDSVRSRLSSLNDNLTRTNIDRIESASFATPSVTPIRAAPAPPAHNSFQQPQRSPPPAVAVPSESRWRLQQEMLNKQLEDFRRGGGETMSAQEWATATNAAAPGSPLSNFAEMQKRLRSKLASMSVNNPAAPQGGYEASYSAAAPPPPQPSFTSAPPSARPEIIPPFQQQTLSYDEDDVVQHVQQPTRHAQPRGGVAATPRGVRATSPRGATAVDQQQAAAAAAGGGAGLMQSYQAPSLIGGLVSRFAPTSSSSNGGAAGATAKASEAPPSNAGNSSRRVDSGVSSPAPSTRTRGIAGAELRTRVATATTSPPRTATRSPAPSTAAATRSTVYPSGGAATSGDVAAQPGSQKVLLTGAEVFAVLRMRGVIVSKGATGEHLLPAAQCHEIILSAVELQQLDHLRETLRQQQRNAPRGASARPRTPPPAAGLGQPAPSLRSTEAALAVADKTSHARGGSRTGASPPRSRWH